MLSKIKKKLAGSPKQPDSGFILKKGSDALFHKGLGSEITNSSIVLNEKSQLIIHDNVKIDNYNISLSNGYLEIGQFSNLKKGNQYLKPSISIEDGRLIIGDYNVVRANITIRFGGKCSIGTYNAINEETEIRCDESILIGDYNMISYQCMIYDTNAHCVYSPEKRRRQTKENFPVIGMETEKPDTKEVIIGSDNWLGKRSVILKGCRLGNQVTVGTNAVASNIKIEKGVLVGNPAFAIVDK